MADPITYADFAKLELRVAKVLEARPHPNADRLLLVQVDLGDEQKQIVAGIRQHYSPEQLVGKLIVIVNNLEPAMLRGEVVERHVARRHVERKGGRSHRRRP